MINEVARCLRPGGTFSAFSSAVTGTSGNAEIDKILGEAEGKALRRVLPPPETSPTTRTMLETAHSHHDNVAFPPDLFTHETRVHWNKDSNVFYFQSNPAAVDRRNLSSEGYKEIVTELKGYAQCLSSCLRIIAHRPAHFLAKTQFILERSLPPSCLH